LQTLIERERRNDPLARSADWSDVETIHYLDAEGFDDLLSRCVVFLDLYDSVVNNSVVECIVRGTPVVLNRLPALVELLGDGYPLFFSSLEEAARKAEDFELIARAASHLESMPKERFSGEYFAQSIAQGRIYSSLPVPG
jgi:glycosyltransferase involved in cell wall biosynthesis